MTLNSTGKNLMIIGRLLSLLMILGLFASTAIVSIAETLLLLIWIFFIFTENKVVIAILKTPPITIGLCLFVIIIIQTSYSNDSTKNALNYAAKYRELLLLPILIFFLNETKWKNYVQYGFILSISLVIIHSYMQFFGLTLDTVTGKQIYTSTLGRIYGAIILGFLAFLFLSKSTTSNVRNHKIYFFIGFVLSSIALLIFFNGRTGILVYLSTMTLWLYRFQQRKGIIIAFFAGITLLTIVYFSSTSIQERIISTKSEISSLIQTPAKIDCLTNTSSLNRAELYINTLNHIELKTLFFGNGTGSLENHLLCVGNPHNQFLLTLYDNGIIGLIFLLAFFYAWWQYSKKLTEENKWLLRSLITMFFVGSLFNSLLMDNAEAHFYVLFLSTLVPIISSTENNSLST